MAIKNHSRLSIVIVFFSHFKSFKIAKKITDKEKKEQKLLVR